MNLQITPLDPADRPVVEAVHALRVAAEAVDVPDFPGQCWHAFLTDLTRTRRDFRHERLLGWAGDELVGYAAAELPQLENLENAEVELSVHPAHRRRGYGQAMHAALLERLRQLGRRRLAGHSVASLAGGPARDPAGGEFAAAMGAKPALEEVRRRLVLADVDDDALDELLAAAYSKAAGYELVTWQGSTPEEFAADAGYLDGRLVSDAPTGDLQWEAPQIDVARLREREEHLALAKRRVYSAGAVHRESGRLVALTALGLADSLPWHAFQWITLVDPEHRGHRLGALVKIENLRFARLHERELQVIDTWNAAVNQHMISINEAVGFRPVDRWVNWQQEV